MKRLPYRLRTTGGTVVDAEFPLHCETVSAMRVSQILSSVLGQVSREASLDGRTSNGDVLQALAMALAVRSAMVEAPKQVTDRLTRELVEAALEAMDGAAVSRPQVGHA